MSSLPPWKLPPADQIAYALAQLPAPDRLRFLAWAERAATKGKDEKLLAAIAAWRLAQQLKD
jgi:hypothetical protein